MLLTPRQLRFEMARDNAYAARYHEDRALEHLEFWPNLVTSLEAGTGDAHAVGEAAHHALAAKWEWIWCLIRALRAMGCGARDVSPGVYSGES